MTISWEKCFQDIKAGSIDRAYVFAGAEVYMKRAALDLLREKLLPPGLEQMNEITLDGADAQKIIEAAETVPFMAERRLVVARGFAPLTGKQKGGKDEEARLVEWLQNAPATCCLVLDQPSTDDKPQKPSAALEKALTVVTFARLDNARLGKWLEQYAKRRGAAIDRRATDALTFMAGQDLTRLSQEMDKLIAFAGDREIDKNMVESLVAPSTECTVFQMIDALFGGKPDRAQQLYRNMRVAGETNIGILAMLTRQTRMLAHIKNMRAQGDSLDEITRRLALNPYSAKRAEAQSRATDAATLEAYYRMCVELDYQIKSGRIADDDALTLVLFKLGAQT